MSDVVETRGKSKASGELSNTAKLLNAYMQATGNSCAKTIAETLKIPVRTIQRLKLDIATATSATCAMDGVSETATSATDGVFEPPHAPSVAVFPSRVIDNNKLTNLVDSLEINIPPTPKRKRSTSKSEALEAFNAYNETALRCGLPQAAKFTPNRERAIAARLKDYGLDGWKRALANIEKSAFLTGGTDHGFRADLDFVCQAKSFGKLHDGGYGNGRHTEQPKQPQEFDWSQGPAWWREEYERMRGAN